MGYFQTKEVAYCVIVLIHPRQTCAVRVAVLSLSVGLSVSVSTYILKLQPMKRLVNDTNGFSATKAHNVADFDETSSSRARNWHCRGPCCVAQPGVRMRALRGVYT